MPKRRALWTGFVAGAGGLLISAGALVGGAAAGALLSDLIRLSG
jgi:hypothetical protein